MKQTIWLLLTVLAVLPAAAQNTKTPLSKRVDEFHSRYPTPERIARRLDEWTKAEPLNADPYVLAANAYLKCASSISVTAGDKADGFAVLVDPKTHKQAGTMSRQTDPNLQRRALDTLAVAVQKFPDRLDIHLGRISIAEQLNDVAAIREAGEAMLKHAASHLDNLRWIDGTALDKPAAMKVADEIHPRIQRLYNRQKDDSDLAASVLAVEALEVAPDDVRLINDAAIFYAYKEQWGKALEYFLRAAKVAPDDLLVQHNLAETNLKLGHVEAARKLWKAIIAKAPPGSDDAKAAEEALKGLDLPKR